jgi:hypothetical protein
VTKATIEKEKPKLKYKCLSPGQCAQAEDGTFDTEQEYNDYINNLTL